MGSFFVYQHYSVTTILQVATPISILKNVILGSSLQYRSSKITPSLFVDKASCTRQFESEFSLHSLASLFPIKEGIFLPLRLSCKESSTSNQAFLLRRKDVNRPTRCSEPLHSKVGGPSKVFAMLCGMGPHGDNYSICISLMLIYTSQRKTKTSNIYCYLLINFAANSKKSATVLKLSNCWQ